MTANLRDAKARLSELVQLAASGEEVIITVRGEATARLVPAKAPEEGLWDRSAWADELAANAESARMGEVKSTSQEAWDELREDRFQLQDRES